MAYVRTTLNDPIIYKKAVLFRCFCFNFRFGSKTVLKCWKGNGIFAHFRYRHALLQEMKNVLIYRIIASTSTCHYSENQVFRGVTIWVLCSKMGCYKLRHVTNRDVLLLVTVLLLLKNKKIISNLCEEGKKRGEKSQKERGQKRL